MAHVSKLKPDRDELALFISTLFKYATAGNWISLRAFRDKGEKNQKPFSVTPHKLNGNFDALIDKAYDDAEVAANSSEKVVFCPPIATFKIRYKAREVDLAEGLALSVECDADAQAALAKLEALLGPATIVVESGGVWIDPATGEKKPRLHAHWRLNVPERSETGLALLKAARILATAIVGGDASNDPIVHPIRWPGSWHRKYEPKLCHIIAINPDAEIELDEAFKKLKEAAPDVEVKVDETLKAKPAFAPSNSAVDLDKLADALEWVPNEELDWTEWKNMALRINAGVKGAEGFALFQGWSQKCPEYDPRTGPAADCQCWEEVSGCPPTRTGIEKIYKIAREHGWQWHIEPTYPEITYSDVDAARSEVRRRVSEFLEGEVACPESKSNVWLDYYLEGLSDPITHAMRITTGIGKTSAAVGDKTLMTTGELVTWLREVRGTLKGPVIYVVPRHKLGEKIEEQFPDDINVRVFRGRTADDPENPGKQICLNLTAVELAVKTHADVTKTCCVDGKKECYFKKRCGYFRQMPAKDEWVDVWIIASDMLFHTQKVFGNPVAVFIDESFWQKGLRGIKPEKKLRGIERKKNEIEWSVAISSLLHDEPETLGVDDVGLRDHARHRLGKALKRQKANGEWSVAISSLLHDEPETLGVDDVGLRDHARHRLGKALKRQKANGGFITDEFFEWSAFDLKWIIIREWKLMPKIEQYLRPGMSNAEIKRLVQDNKELLDTIQHTRRVIKIWQELRSLETEDDGTISGRLTLKQKNGQRVIEWRGVEQISEQFRKPTLMLDATLPALEILQVYHPQVKIIANIDVAMPAHVHTRQVLHAPTSSNKLNDEKHLVEMRRYIMRRWFETGCQKTLVVAQQKVEEYLNSCGLPDNIKVEHYNNISGRDDYRDVRLQILLGGTAPGPKAMEAIAAALSGTQPKLAVPGPNGFTWYERTKRGIRLPDGRGVETNGDKHCDAFVESVRYLIHEVEQIQALGRSRGVNRTANMPLDIDLVFDTCLPITVDEVLCWETPSAAIEMLIEGTVLMSPVDMVKAWPLIWKNEKAADRSLPEMQSMLSELIADWRVVTYQPIGPKMKLRIGYFNPNRIPDPKAWLEQRVGLLKVYRDGEGL